MNTQKGFLPILGLVLLFTIIGGGAYVYTQSDIDIFNIKKVNLEVQDVFNATSSEDMYSCSENSDCQKNEICYFKPGGEKGSCTGRWNQKGEETEEYTESKVPVSKNNLIQCSRDEDCKNTGECLLVPNGDWGYCATENTQKKVVEEKKEIKTETQTEVEVEVKKESTTELVACSKDEDCKTNETCLLAPGGDWGYCTVEN